MPTLNLKPTHKPVRGYYDDLQRFADLGQSKETVVREAFKGLLDQCAQQFRWTVVPEYPIKRLKQSPVYVDAALIDTFRLPHGYWEAKDDKDDLPKEIKRKFEAGYPRDNILFQAPTRAILWQDGRQVLDADISRPDVLVETLEQFFAYQPPAYAEWNEAVEQFKDRIPQIAGALVELIRDQRVKNKKFAQAFGGFSDLCRVAINPNLADAAIEEMLIQHLLTERIFRKVFDNPDFANRNIIAAEIEKVIAALTAKAFSRDTFLKPLDRFYTAIEHAAATIDDFSQKQAFLNTVYEKFFQGFSVKVADTHGVVYTPQPIVDFMVRSVEELLRKEFGRSLSDPGVHILDPFVGTGNFIVRVMREIKRTALKHKYLHELHCNEVMLLPYYIAAMNIEHEFFDLIGDYEPFPGICLVDTFELAEGAQPGLFTMENTERVERQRRAPVTVVIGNPPYNVGQLNENDNNKNRKYRVLDRRVSDTYACDSEATNKNALSDPYVKAIRWASDRIGDEGIVALVTNNSFIDQIAFDGMRRWLKRDFDRVYVVDLGGNVRKNPKLSGTTHNVFGIQVGVSVNIFVRNRRKK